ncbi:MAG: hydrolase [Alphaproteobacteria bacterium]|nr:hydrolase [Alphaproteobacteria bacterium]
MNYPSKYAAVVLLAVFAFAKVANADIREPLTPENSVLLYVDLQPQYVFTVNTTDAGKLINNATGLAKAAKLFNVPTIFTTISAKSFAGPMFAKVQSARPDVTPIDRTSINALDTPEVLAAIKATGRKKIVIGGLWTDSCVVLPTLGLLKRGYEVYVVADVAGDVDAESHERGMQRMIQAGAVPVTWLPVILEWQKDWSNKATAGPLAEIAEEHGGTWGQGVFYVRSMGIGK